jgi:hypothetical protein
MLTDELLETLTRAEPRLNIYCEEPDRVVLDFTMNERHPSELILDEMETHPVGRSLAAMERIIDVLTYCGNCARKNHEARCRRRHTTVLATMRMILPDDDFQKLLNHTHDRVGQVTLDQCPLRSQQ